MDQGFAGGSADGARKAILHGASTWDFATVAMPEASSRALPPTRVENRWVTAGALGDRQCPPLRRMARLSKEQQLGLNFFFLQRGRNLIRFKQQNNDPGRIDDHDGVTRGIQRGLAAKLYAKISWRFIPFPAWPLLICYIDRVTIGFCQLQSFGRTSGLNDAHFLFLPPGLFFVTYRPVRHPQNLVLARTRGFAKRCCGHHGGLGLLNRGADVLFSDGAGELLRRRSAVWRG